ncbi:translocation/assembly module TamB [Adhaeribacter sp. BT258]|uniref:Translocation/assembly module TamB n=1 Tax=Adhaeribacter terrigena TaxID=2793070 RepID=A0ABS1C316_9BACT|nr:translocation/assembly module TamB domain-containing protein [Adhaeribacter terrigena]MBK0403718.1 translocation/assembly module TamB [Adhaeribacter terrigena]
MAQKAASFISETIGHKVTIEKVDIKFFKNVLLDKVRVLDVRGNELFYIGQLDADISVFSIFEPNKLSISTLTLTEPRTHLIQYRGTDSLNLSTFIHSIKQLITPDTTTTSKPFDFHIGRLVLQNGYFTYDNQNDPHTDFGLDYQHMKLASINADLSEIELLGDTIKARIKGLTAFDLPSKTHLKNLDVKMTYAPTFWEWDEMDLKVGRSNLRHYVRFDYHHFFNFTDFNDSVFVTARLDSSAVYSDDIAQFAPQLKDWKEKVLITANIKGKTSRFDAKNVDIYYGKNTHVVGNISATGLPNMKETFAELKLKPSRIDADDLKRYIPEDAFAYADRLGTVKLQGQFVGFYNDFVANGSFQTDLGSFVSDINLKLNKNKTQSSYRGYLKTDNFQVGKLIGDESVLKNISIDGRIAGTGFDTKTANLELDATIKSLNFNNYTYRNITTNGKLGQQKFSGAFSVNDPNLVMKGNGTINLEQGNQRFDLTTNIENANLKQLNFTPQDFRVKTQATLHFSGYRPDDLLGTASLRNTTLTFETKPVQIDSLDVVSAKTGGIRTLDVRSELLNFDAKGDFNYTTLIRDIAVLVQEYKLNFENNPTATANYYRKKDSRSVPADYALDFNLHLKKANPLLHIFVPDFSVSDNAKITGNFRNGQTAIFGFSGQIDTLLYGDYKLFTNTLELTTSKLPFSPEVLAQAFLTSQKQQIPSAGATENFFAEGVWTGQKIQFATNIAQTGTTNKAAFSGDLNFLPNRLQIVFNKSNVNLLGKTWSISPNNTVEIRGQEIDFRNLVLSYQNQSISASGMLSRDPSQLMQVKVSNFELQNLNPLMAQKMSGVLNADLTARDIYDQIILTSQLRVDSLYFDEILIGNVAGESDWDRRQSRLQVNLGVSRDARKVLNVTGTYNPYGGNQQLNLLAAMEDAPVKIVEPFLKDILSDMDGTMEGRIRILGKLSGPILKGVANVSNGRFKFGYLNTVYTFSDRVYFAENGIMFRGIKLRDIFGNTATLNGGVYHDGFNNMVLDLKTDFRRFMVLNTTREQNDLYYGSAIATGDASIFGPPSNLKLNVDARSEKGTRISIPLNTQAKASRQGFIRFVNANSKDTTRVKVAVEEQKVDLSGINMNFNLDVTEDAYVEIIFDERTGDIIRGTGNGRIRMNIDTRGEFNMYGNYEVVQGAYNFTLYNLVNKEFQVRPGGTINWNGDPYGGNLNIQATNTQRVSLREVLQGGMTDTLGTDNGADSRRYPVTVVMGLSGNLLTPEIKLDMEFNDVPSQVETLLQPFISNIRTDEQELNRQVFSLLVFKRLSPIGEFALNNAGTDALTSISEFVSNQFSYWISQVDSNLEVDIGISGADAAGNPEIMTRIGYSFLEGRLRVSRESSLGSNNQATRTTNATAIGDWRAEYYLRPDGKLRLKLQYVTSAVNTFENNTFTTSSVGFVHTQQFDSFRELFGRKKPSKRLQRAQQERSKQLERIESDDIKPPPI